MEDAAALEQGNWQGISTKTGGGTDERVLVDSQLRNICYVFCDFCDFCNFSSDFLFSLLPGCPSLLTCLLVSPFQRNVWL